MRIQVLSDIHAEVDPRRAHFDVVDLGADLVILAGDIDHGGAGVRWAAETWPTTPVVYVLGNHEHYTTRLGEALERARAAAAGTNVHVLERESVTVRGVRILGATLWTDLNLVGDPAFARAALGQAFPDYKAIESPAGGPLRPVETEAIHHETVTWLERELDQTYAGPTVVVTHHAPSSRSLQQWDEWAGESPYTAWESAYASDLERLLDGPWPPALWIHGHTHLSGDYRIDRTRVVSNQRGYYQEMTGWDPTLVLEVTTLQERRETALACARAALAMLAERDIEACVVGSLARGDFKMGSDADFLVFSPIPPEQQIRLTVEIDHCFDNSDLSVDVTYAGDLDPRGYERMTRHCLYLKDLS
ncbi:metallophosphoesterase [Halofilum ochraceum]|uniref:metallophosphoesterase n=1 Tax=Halofilum ochraceum TaxID=1611323 RepID=UPI0008D96676|nr:metallophosphoesterase [Halofilum ochraceum]